MCDIKVPLEQFESIKPVTHQADGRPSVSICRDSLFGVFPTSALVGLTLVVLCLIQHVESASGRSDARYNSDWMLSLENESVQEN